MGISYRPVSWCDVKTTTVLCAASLCVCSLLWFMFHLSFQIGSSLRVWRVLYFFHTSGCVSGKCFQGSLRERSSSCNLTGDDSTGWFAVKGSSHLTPSTAWIPSGWICRHAQYQLHRPPAPASRKKGKNIELISCPFSGSGVGWYSLQVE